MKRIILNNDSVIPAVGLGVYRISDLEVAEQTVANALSVGYRLIDTAMIYGNEEAVGKAIHKSGIPREEIFVTTKLWNDAQTSGFVSEALNASLERMGLDYVDLYLVHWPLKDTYVSVWEKMEEVYRNGKTKAIGVCNYEPHHLDDLLKVAKVPPVIDQIECNPYFTQDKLIHYCKRKGIVPEAWAPLGAGLLGVLNDPLITDIAARHSKTPAQIVIRWHLERGLIAIPKTVHKARLIENLDVDDFELTPAEIMEISGLNKNDRKGVDPDNIKPDSFDF